MRADPGGPAPSSHSTYRASIVSARPDWHFTPRIVPHHPEALIPVEAPLIAWPK